MKPLHLAVLCAVIFTDYEVHKIEKTNKRRFFCFTMNMDAVTCGVRFTSIKLTEI